jgi:hypothetical protein
LLVRQFLFSRKPARAWLAGKGRSNNSRCYALLESAGRESGRGHRGCEAEARWCAEESQWRALEVAVHNLLVLLSPVNDTVWADCPTEGFLYAYRLTLLDDACGQVEMSQVVASRLRSGNAAR